MTKKSASSKQSWRRSSPNAVPSAVENRLPIDRLAAWIGKQSRLIRSVLVALIAIILTGTIALLEYNYLLSVPATNPLFTVMDDLNLLLINLVILAVIGIGFYWVGWRLMIGFDLQDTPLRPGRPAAFWLLTGLLVLMATSCLTSITVMDALR